MKTKLLRKLRKRSRRIEYNVLSNYVVIADYDIVGCEVKRYSSLTLSDFGLLSIKQLEQKLRFERRKFILEKLKELRDVLQMDLMESKAKRLNKTL